MLRRLILYGRISLQYFRILGADDLTLEEEGVGGGWGGHFWSSRIFFLAIWWQDIFFPSKCSAGYFFPPHFSAGLFFLKKGSCVYIYKMYLHLHCGHCSNSSNMELQSLKMLYAIQNHYWIAMFSESHSLHSFYITSK